jgi:hypothetical protein
VRVKDERTREADVSEKRRRKLAAGVLKQAARDLRRFRGATSKAGRELYLDAYRWLTANESSWPFSFLNVCQTLKLAPDTAREQLISAISLGPFDCWRLRLASTAML